MLLLRSLLLLAGLKAGFGQGHSMRIERPPFDWELFEKQLQIFLPCAHFRAEPRRKAKSNGQPFYKIQCPDCGKALTGQLAYTMVAEWRANLGPIKPFDESKQQAWVECRLAVGDLLKLSQALQQNAAWWAEYETYLSGPAWKARRCRIFERAEGVCEHCRQSPARHVHHLTYERVGDELETDLLAVCLPCHQAFHPDRPILAAL